MNNLAKVIALGGRRLNKALAMHYLFSEQGKPEVYIPLAYIESTGTQYINTGFTPNQDTRVVCDFQFTEPPDTQWIVFGARTGGAGSDFHFVFGYNLNNGFRTDYLNSQNYVNGNFDSIGRHTVDKNKNITTIDGSTVKQNYGKFTTNDLVLSGISSNGSVWTRTKMRLYSCQIYDNNVLVRDYKPCMSPTGEVGLYDLVDRKFYGNNGTGEFIAGRSIDKYVHDSANLFLDGIWNAGEGVHSDKLTSWVDLSGNCQPTPLGTGNTVGENCITSDGTDNGRMTVPDFDPINLDTFTLEVLFKRNGNVDANQVIIGRAYTKSYYLNTYSNNLTVWLGGKQNNLNNVINETDKFLVQITHTGSSFSVWLDGVKVISDKLNTILADTSRLNLFGHSGNKTTFMGSIFAMRLHNRVLSDAELAQNYEIDQARFGLTETASVMSLRMAEEEASE